MLPKLPKLKDIKEFNPAEIIAEIDRNIQALDKMIRFADMAIANIDKKLVRVGETETETETEETEEFPPHIHLAKAVQELETYLTKETCGICREKADKLAKGIKGLLIVEEMAEKIGKGELKEEEVSKILEGKEEVKVLEEV